MKLFSYTVTRLLTCVIFLALSVLLKQRVLPRHQRAVAPLQSHPSVQLRSLSTVSPVIHSLHSPPVSNLHLMIPRVGSLSLAPLCLYQVIRVSASRRWSQCLPNSILMPSPRRLRRCLLITTLVRNTSITFTTFCCVLMLYSVLYIVFLFTSHSMHYSPFQSPCLFLNQASVCLGRLSWV